MALLSIKLLLLVRLLVRDARLLGLLQGVAALVLLLHAVDEQCDQEGSEEGAHHPTYDHSCGERDRGQSPQRQLSELGVSRLGCDCEQGLRSERTVLMLTAVTVSFQYTDWSHHP